MGNTYRPKPKWSRLSYIVLSVTLASTILGSILEYHAYAGWPPPSYFSNEYTRNQSLAMIVIPLIVVGGLGFMAAIARRSLSITTNK